MGVSSIAEARSAGYGPDEIRALRSSGRWVRLRQGVHTTAEDLAVTERDGVRHAVDCLAVLTSLARPTAVVSHASAAEVWGWPAPRRELDTVVRVTELDVGRGWGALDRRLRAMLAVAGPADRRFTVAPRTVGRRHVRRPTPQPHLRGAVLTAGSAVGPREVGFAGVGTGAGGSSGVTGK